jgi:ATP phosphoribosyltransferase regulatory subunit
VTPAALLPEGLRDRLPPQADAADRLVRGVLDHVRSHGYDHVQPPMVEFEESLAGQLLTGGRRDLLRFIDPVSQRTLALRSDITGQVGRIAATRLAHAPRPLRLSYGGPVLRVRGTQLSPAREMLQAGAELIGRDSVAAATEILGIAVAALIAAGLDQISVDLTLPDTVETLAGAIMPPERMTRLKALLDMKDAGALAAEGFADWQPLLAATGPVDIALPRLRAFDHAGLLASRIDGVAALAAALDVPVTLDPTERHGFDYQSWLGFSIFAGSVRGEIGRGGTYSVRHDGGEEPAVGFSLYVDTLVDAGLGIVARRRIALPHGTAAAVGADLRAGGWSTVAALDAAHDTGVPHGCTHMWNGVEPVAI